MEYFERRLRPRDLGESVDHDAADADREEAPSAMCQRTQRRRIEVRGRRSELFQVPDWENRQ
jgi:hypothetical protein